MKVTSLSAQQRNPDRVNVFIDGKFRFSLFTSQIIDLKIKIGNDYTDAELSNIIAESEFGKIYGHALEYCLMRPHSSREVRDYLYKKTFEKRYRSKKSGEIVSRPGISKIVTDRVYDKLVARGYIDDEKFTRYWVDNRRQRQGISHRKITAELVAKGVDRGLIDRCLRESRRNDTEELKKIIERKIARYSDEKKLIAYLARQGFSYDDIQSALLSRSEEEY